MFESPYLTKVVDKIYLTIQNTCYYSELILDIFLVTRPKTEKLVNILPKW